MAAIAFEPPYCKMDTTPFRVLLLARPATGGLRAHIVELARRLDPAICRARICGPDEFIISLPPDLQGTATAVCPVAARLSPSDLHAALQLRRILAEPGKDIPTIVHAHGLRAVWVASLAHVAFSFPIVVTLHNVPPSGALSTLVLRFLARSASRTICVSEAIKLQLTTPATVIPNGVEIERYRNLDRDGSRALLGIGQSEFLIGCIARLSYEKGVDVLVAAALLLPDVTVVIAGDGPEKELLQEAVPKNVRFIGRQDSILPLLAAADIIAVPSRSEGQGIVALEALASNRAVVASNVGGLPEMIRHEVNGLLVQPDNPVLLAEALRRLKSDPQLRKKLADSGYEYAARHGDIDQRVREIERVYMDVLA